MFSSSLIAGKIKKKLFSSPSMKRVRFWGVERACPCCHSFLRRFEPFGEVPRPEARCPVCNTLERHRLIWMYFKQKTNLFTGQRKKMLHVAPEEKLSSLLCSAKNIDYISADLDGERADLSMDITDIQFPDHSFDVIYCSHVLEHVTDDRKAMSEFFRILKPGGWAVLQVPISGENTEEDLTITCPKERKRLYGQWNHVRRYGKSDYKDRLSKAGFEVHIDDFAEAMGSAAAKRYGISSKEKVFFCMKVEAPFENVN